jgi:hypothetical protein
MGAVNYKTSDYITIGYNLNDIDRVEPFYSDFIEDDYIQVKWLLEKQRFYYFNVKIEPGYYEGFTIDIENNFAYCFNDYLEKLDALKEATRLKKFLIEIVNDFNMVACYPGWCMGYSDYKTTLKEINNAIRELKSEIKTTPTWYTLKKAGEF